MYLKLCKVTKKTATHPVFLFLIIV